MVWYYAAAPPATAPIAALVVQSVSGEGSQGVGGPAPTFNLATFAPATGVMTFAAAVPFYYGARPASGAWCTMMRVNENLAGAWPTQQEALEFAEHGLTAQQKQAAGEARVATAAAAAAQTQTNGNGGNLGAEEVAPHTVTRTTTRTTTRTAHRP